MEKGTQTLISEANFVTICNDKSGMAKECYELALDGNGRLPMETLHVQFPSATAIKYKNPDTGIMRILTQVRGLICAPPEGWGKIQFTTVNPINQDPMKRGAVSDRVLGQPPNKQGRGLLDAPPTVNQLGPPQQMTPSPLGNLRFSMGGPLPVGGPMMNNGMAMNLMTSPRGPAPGMQQSTHRMTPQQDYNFAEDTFTVPMPTFRPPVGMGGGAEMTSPHFVNFCDICELALPSSIHSRMHFDGKRHADAVLSQGRPDGAMFNVGGGGMPPNAGGNIVPLFNGGFMNSPGNFGPRSGGIGSLGGNSVRGRQHGGISGGRGKSFLSTLNGRQKGAGRGAGGGGAGNRGGRGGGSKSTPNGKYAGGRSFASDDHSMSK